MDLEKVLRSPVKSAVLCAVVFGAIFLIRALIDLASQPFGFCVLLLGLMAVAGLVVVSLPLALVFLVVRASIKPKRKGETPAPATDKARSTEAGQAAGVKERLTAEELQEFKRSEIVSKLKREGRLDRLALVYYVEASLREGCAAGDVATALRTKGWREADIAAAFQTCGLAAENL